MNFNNILNKIKTWPSVPKLTPAHGQKYINYKKKCCAIVYNDSIIKLYTERRNCWNDNDGIYPFQFLKETIIEKK